MKNSGDGLRESAGSAQWEFLAVGKYERSFSLIPIVASNVIQCGCDKREGVLSKLMNKFNIDKGVKGIE